jgi:hypothetical protein
MSNAEYSAEHRAGVAAAVSRTEPLLSNSEKIDYLYRVAVKLGALVDAVTPAQVEQVKKLQSNPLLSKLFAGIVKSTD